MTKYYRYHIPESFLTILIGNDKQQIIDTMEYYHKQTEKLKVPSENQIGEMSSLEIRCGLSMMSNKFDFKAQITENLSLYINANAVDYIQGVALSYKLSKRGGLYKLEPGISSFGLYFLPEDLMIAIRDYDWTKHQDIIGKWNKFFDNIDFGDKMLLSRDIKKNPKDNN